MASVQQLGLWTIEHYAWNCFLHLNENTRESDEACVIEGSNVMNTHHTMNLTFYVKSLGVYKEKEPNWDE